MSSTTILDTIFLTTVFASLSYGLYSDRTNTRVWTQSRCDVLCKKNYVDAQNGVIRQNTCLCCPSTYTVSAYPTSYRGNREAFIPPRDPNYKERKRRLSEINHDNLRITESFYHGTQRSLAHRFYNFLAMNAVMGHALKGQTSPSSFYHPVQEDHVNPSRPSGSDGGLNYGSTYGNGANGFIAYGNGNGATAYVNGENGATHYISGGNGDVHYLNSPNGVPQYLNAPNAGTHYLSGHVSSISSDNVNRGTVNSGAINDNNAAVPSGATYGNGASNSGTTSSPNNNGWTWCWQPTKVMEEDMLVQESKTFQDSATSQQLVDPYLATIQPRWQPTQTMMDQQYKLDSQAMDAAQRVYQNVHSSTEEDDSQYAAAQDFLSRATQSIPNMQSFPEGMGGIPAIPDMQTSLSMQNLQTGPGILPSVMQTHVEPSVDTEKWKDGTVSDRSDESIFKEMKARFPFQVVDCMEKKKNGGKCNLARLEGGEDIPSVNTEKLTNESENLATDTKKEMSSFF